MKMMTEFITVGRRTIESAPPWERSDHVFISIRTPGDPDEVKLPTCGRTAAVLHMSFHDIDPNPPTLRPQDRERWHARLDALKEGLFNKDMAENILAFARVHKRCGLFVVHCDAGYSRSPAVAAALSRTVFGQDDSYWLTAYKVNRHVYEEIVSAFHRHDARAWSEVP